jgi:hypothetical protein
LGFFPKSKMWRPTFAPNCALSILRGRVGISGIVAFPSAGFRSPRLVMSAQSAPLTSPDCLRIDTQNNLIFVDPVVDRVFRIDHNSGTHAFCPCRPPAGWGIPGRAESRRRPASRVCFLPPDAETPANSFFAPSRLRLSTLGRRFYLEH